MIPSRLSAFSVYERRHFDIGGDTGELHSSAREWRTFGQSAIEASSDMKALNAGRFFGDEGDRYRELVNAHFPSQLTTTGDAHTGVGDAIRRYAEALAGHKIDMNRVISSARRHHHEVNDAVVDFYRAGGTAVLAGTGAGEAAEAYARYQRAKTLWDADVADAERIKAALYQDVTEQANVIKGLARESYAENPNNMQKAWDSIKDFFVEHSDALKVIADILQVVGTALAFVCAPLGIAVAALGVLLKAGLAAAGQCSWGEVVFDAVTMGIPGGGKALQFGAKAMKQAAGSAALKSAGAINKLGSEKLAKDFYRAVTRGSEVCFKLEPVDMATGNMVDFQTDVFIDGTLPLVVDRNANTNHQFGRALGPRWVSAMDVRIEICDGEILMLSTDGALLTFPPAPEDGSEVRADGRPWLLSYSDGAYHVRNIADGLTYIFRLYDPDTDSSGGGEQVGVADQSPSIGESYVAASVPNGSLAEALELGIEIGLSTLVHRSGASIEYSWDTATGHMTEMRRSDNTILHISWDDTVDRVASISVSNPETHPEDEPLQLISYEYDPYGQLVRVINSNDGALQYHYDDFGRMHAWTDRNGASYFYRFDEHGRVHSQVGTGGMFPNIVYWAQDTGADAPEGGTVCVAIETAGEFQGDPLELGDSVVSDYLDRLEQLPLYQALASGGLEAAGLTGRGRAAHRDDDKWNVPSEWLHDDFLGDIRPTVYRSTPAGDVWRIVTPEGGVEDTTYNSYHQTTSITNSAGATFTYVYNEDGILTSTGFPDGLESRIDPGSWGTPVRLIGRDGQATEYEVDAFGMIESVTDPAGLTTSFTYDVRPSGIVPSSVTDPDGTITRIECDNAGLTLATTDPAGRRSSMVRDVRGLIIEAMDPVGATTSITYTPEGWPQRVTNPDGTTLFSIYDGEGNQLTAVNEIGARTTSTYTVFDMPVSTTDATGATTRVEYNTQMQPIRLTNADNNTWSYTYDLDGMIAAEVDYNGIVTTHAITPDGRTITDTTPLGATTRTMRADGLIDSVTDTLGTTEYLYDDVARLIALVGPHARIDYRRDDYGRVLGETVTLTTGEITAHDYTVDHTGTIAAERISLPSGDSFTSTFERDETGRFTSSHHSHTCSGSTTPVTVADLTYGVDACGIRNRITTGVLVRSIETDIRGRISTDTLNAMDSTVPGGRRTVSSRKFDWRADDALARVSDQLRGQTAYGMDALGRVLSVTRDAESQPTNHRSAKTTAVDTSSRWNGDSASESVERYGFSTAGVLATIDTANSASLYKTPPQRRGTSTDIRNPRDAAARSDARVEFDGTKPVRVGRTSYSYDACGRVTRTVTKRISKKPLVQEFFYSAGEQPIGFRSSDEPDTGYRYLYDPLGRRVAKERISTISGDVLTRTVYVHAGDQLIAEQTTLAQNTTLRTGIDFQARVGDGYVWTADPDTGEVIGQIRLSKITRIEAYAAALPDRGHGDALTWPQDQVDAQFMLMMSDLAGAPQELVDPINGVVTGQATQSLYGTRSWRGSVTSPLLFSGQYLDAESGWAYNRFRYYSPQAGMYNAQDPLGLPPRVASAQGYVDHAAYWIDEFGLAAHVVSKNYRRMLNSMTPAEKGKLGEDLTKDIFHGKFNPLQPRSTYRVDNRTRISDLTLNSDGHLWYNGKGMKYFAGDIVESKFVKKQGLSRQIRDGIAHAGEDNIYHLVVAPHTKLSRPLLRMAETNPNFNIIRIPAEPLNRVANIMV